jgi:hypothetical protein
MPAGDTWIGYAHYHAGLEKDYCEHCTEHYEAGTQQPTWMRPMYCAPEGEARILLCYRPRLHSFNSGEWESQGPTWMECRWVSDEEKTGSPAHYEPWCGNPRTHSSEHIRLENCLGWLPVPGLGENAES